MEPQQKHLANWLVRHHQSRDFMINYPIEGFETVADFRKTLLWFKRRGFIKCQSWSGNNWTGCITDLGAKELAIDGTTDSWLWDS